MDLQKLKSKKILVVEDDMINRELINEIFDDIDVELTSVITGSQAVEIVKKTSFDLILMDIQIPEINGFDAANIINKEQPDVPIIAQTAYAFESDRQKAMESGCVDYIAKPFKKEELLRLVIKFIK